jgi:hypothetical protein
MPLNLECYYCHKPLASIHEQHTADNCIAWLKQQEQADQERHAKAQAAKAEHPPALPNGRSKKLSDNRKP